MRSQLTAITLAALAGAAINPTTAGAQAYPSRPLKLLTDVGTGGTYDIYARILSEELYKRLGQPVIVEPRPSANGVIGGRACAESPPDGYTLCVLSSQGLVTNQFLYKSLPYSLASFTPITNLFFNTQVMVVSASLGVRSIPDLVALAKAKPGTLSYTAPGNFQRAFFEDLNKKHGIDLVSIPFRGGGDAVTGLLSGNVPIAFVGGANFAAFVREGKMVALAVDAPVRSPLFPDTPTLAELGTEPRPRNYLTLMAPANTPAPIIARLYSDVVAIMYEPEFRRRHLIERGLEPVADPPDAFARFLEKDLAMTGTVAKAAGIEPQ